MAHGGLIPLDRLRLTKSFQKRFKKKTPEMQTAIQKCFSRLGDDPQHPSLRVRKMKGRDGVWEARVDRKNRVTFHWEKGTICMRNHCNHDILDRNP